MADLGLKIRCPKGRVGSTPTLGTIFLLGSLQARSDSLHRIELEVDNGYLVCCVARSEVSVETRIALFTND